jgi:hypothetical protein
MASGGTGQVHVFDREAEGRGCVTCGTSRRLQCSHFYSRRYLSRITPGFSGAPQNVINERY